jgi:phosphohistidine phosphatase
MNLYLLRHGPAEPRDIAHAHADRDRALTSEGRAKVRRIAEAMAAMELSFDWILSSPFMRARETAELVAAGLRPRRPVTLCDELAAEAEPADLPSYLAGLRPLPRDLLLVGHQPFLGALAALLLGSRCDRAVDFKKGGLAYLVWETPPGGKATLVWLLTPGLMKRMA